MKTMTCTQLGGACEEKFSANTFDEIALLSKNHGMQMFQKKDPAHMEAMNKMMALMQDPDAMQKWFEEKKQLFNNLPED